MKTKNTTIIVWAVIILILLALLFLKLGSQPATQPSGNNNPTTGTTTSTSTATTGTTSTLPILNQSVSDGTITAAYSSSDIALATTQAQVAVTSYIPPCDSGFTYCLYYTGTQYAGTNFESAGIRIQKRADLSTQQLCMDTPPAGFDATKMPDSTNSGNGYTTSTFANVGDAAAGHYSSGALYRLYIAQNSSCYEFETRIGQSQFANYPAGTIQEFTPADMTAVQAALTQIINGISLPSGKSNLFS